MGDEITHVDFRVEDFTAFKSSLEKETRLLGQWFQNASFSTHTPICGLELETWLIDRNGMPTPRNEELLNRLNDPLVVPELARFNIELNAHPQPLHGRALHHLHENLLQTWKKCQTAAEHLEMRMMMIGTLPSIRQQDLTLANMSGLKRYQALNDQVLRLRDGHPLKLDIYGNEHLNIVHNDVMLEAASTSLQLHIKVGSDDAVRYYNAAQIISAPLVAVGGNSPYLFGKDLWNETRIPLFEQSVEVGGFAGAARGPIRRVSFGTGYAKKSLFECFVENEQHFPVLLPIRFSDPAEKMRYLRLHNGTIWRWNRPLIGYDDDGTPHVRIEQRVMSAGPSIIDAIANAAFFFGLVHALATCESAPENQLPFATARDNFYAAARHGLDASMIWMNGRKLPIKTLLLDKLIPLARYGLTQLEINEQDRDLYLGIIKERVTNACTGADWQRAWMVRHRCSMYDLCEAFYERQQTETPVHDWQL